MKVTLIADSCFLFEYKGVRVLTDPWIGGTVAGGSWIQYPQPTIRAEDIGPLDYIFISHIHEDHCQLQTLRKLDASASIILLDRKPNFVANFLAHHKLNFKAVINIKLREKFLFAPDCYFEPVEADPSHKLNYLIDSSLLIHYDGKTIYFGNDNPPYPGIDAYLSRYSFELAILPPVGGSGYPAFYTNLTDDEKRAEAHTIISNYHRELEECLHRLKPRLFACAANGHLLSGKRHKMNKFMAWPANPNSPYQYLAASRQPLPSLPLLLSPGIAIDLDQSSGSSLLEAVTFYDKAAEREEFIREVACHQPYFYEFFELSPSISFQTLFMLAHERLKKFLISSDISLPWFLCIKYPNDRFCNISLEYPYDIDVETQPPSCNRLIIDCEPRVLYMLLTGGFSWNIADATGFIEYNRSPNVYIYDIYIALNYFRL